MPPSDHRMQLARLERRAKQAVRVQERLRAGSERFLTTVGVVGLFAGVTSGTVRYTGLAYYANLEPMFEATCALGFLTLLGAATTRKAMPTLLWALGGVHRGVLRRSVGQLSEYEAGEVLEPILENCREPCSRAVLRPLVDGLRLEPSELTPAAAPLGRGDEPAPLPPPADPAPR